MGIMLQLATLYQILRFGNLGFGSSPCSSVLRRALKSCFVSQICEFYSPLRSFAISASSAVTSGFGSSLCSVACPRAKRRVSSVVKGSWLWLRYAVFSVVKKVLGCSSVTLRPPWFAFADCFLRASVSPWWVLGFRSWLRYGTVKGLA